METSAVKVLRDYLYNTKSSEINLFRISKRIRKHPINVLNYVIHQSSDNNLNYLSDAARIFQKQYDTHKRARKIRSDKKCSAAAKRKEYLKEYQLRKRLAAKQSLIEGLALQETPLVGIAEEANSKAVYILRYMEYYYANGSEVINSALIKHYRQEFNQSAKRRKPAHNLNCEQEVLEGLVADNLSVKEIAGRLHKRVDTIIKYLQQYCCNDSKIITLEVVDKYALEYERIKNKRTRRASSCHSSVLSNKGSALEIIIRESITGILEDGVELTSNQVLHRLDEMGLIEQTGLGYSSAMQETLKILKRLSNESIKKLKRGRFYYFAKRE